MGINYQPQFGVIEHGENACCFAAFRYPYDNEFQADTPTKNARLALREAKQDSEEGLIDEGEYVAEKGRILQRKDEALRARIQVTRVKFHTCKKCHGS